MPDPVTDPPAAARGTSPRWWILGVALGAALLGAFVAPASWPTGPGSVEVTVDDQVVLDEPFEVGSPADIVVEDERDSMETAVAFPAGIPVDDTITAVVTAVGPEGPTPLGDVGLTLILPDGSREPVPLLGDTDDGLDSGLLFHR